jgi:hypothetical protein
MIPWGKDAQGRVQGAFVGGTLDIVGFGNFHWILDSIGIVQSA